MGDDNPCHPSARAEMISRFESTPLDNSMTMAPPGMRQCSELKDNGTNLSVYLDACSDAPLPCEVGEGWGASTASGKSPTLPHCCLLSDAIATFGCTLKHKQPHPRPPLLSQGREQIAASHGAMALKLVPLS